MKKSTTRELDEYYAGAMSKLELHVLCDTENVKLYRMSSPGTRVQSCQICFTPEGISICGDLCPQNNRGVHSSYGYGLGWFVGQLSRDYLASKFLEQQYEPLHAKEFLEYLLEDEDRSEYSKQISDAIDVVENWTYDELVDFMNSIGEYDCITDGVAYYYNCNDMCLLSAIQKRFAELYWRATQDVGQ